MALKPIVTAPVIANILPSTRAPVFNVIDS
jgi:hypothetical protein